MQDYIGDRATIKIFDNNDTNYQANFNNLTLKVLADLDFSLAPIDGGTEILNASITGSKIVAGTLTSDLFAASSSVTTLTNNTYLKGRNTANNADLNMIKINASDNLEHGAYWEVLRAANNKNVGARTVGGADVNWMKENASDQWEWMSSAYSQSILAKTTNTYTLGGASNVYSAAYLQNAYVSDYNASNKFYSENTFTPTINGTTAAGVGTYTAQVGQYVQIGKLVWLSLDVVWNAHTGTGILNIVCTGAPGVSNSGVPYYGPMQSSTSGPTFTGYVTGYINTGVTGTPVINLWNNASGASGSQLTMAATGNIAVSMVYRTT